MNDKRIIFENDEGGVSVIIPAPGVELVDVLKAVPPGKEYEIVEASEIPSDRLFRNAWKKNGKKIEADVEKCKDICHQKRRAKRAQEFAPLDIEATIPAKAQQAEEKRQTIRENHERIQLEIELAETEQELKDILATEEL